MKLNKTTTSSWINLRNNNKQNKKKKIRILFEILCKMRLSLSQKLQILNWGITMKESPVSPVCSLWIVIEINLYTYLNLCMYIFIEFNSRITAQNRNRNSNSKLTTCHTKPFFVHESDSEYICIAMRVNQSVNQPITQPNNQSNSVSQKSVKSVSFIYIYQYQYQYQYQSINQLSTYRRLPHFLVVFSSYSSYSRFLSRYIQYNYIKIRLSV